MSTAASALRTGEQDVGVQDEEAFRVRAASVQRAVVPGLQARDYQVHRVAQCCGRPLPAVLQVRDHLPALWREASQAG